MLCRRRLVVLSDCPYAVAVSDGTAESPAVTVRG